MKKREFIVQDLLSKIYQEEFKEGEAAESKKAGGHLRSLSLYDPAGGEKPRGDRDRPRRSRLGNLRP
jgi:hypothetical protein